MKTTSSRTALSATVLLSIVAVTAGCSQSYDHRIVDTGDNEVTISDQGGSERKTHEVATDAKITLDGQPVTLNELDAGNAVSVTIEEREGKVMTTKINAKTHDPFAKRSTETTETPAAVPDAVPNRPQSNTPQAAVPAKDPDAGSPTSDGPTVTVDQPAEEIVEGAVFSITAVDNQFVVTSENGDEHTLNVNDDTKFTVDGEEAQFGDLQVKQTVNVVAERTSESLIAKSVDATSAT